MLRVSGCLYILDRSGLGRDGTACFCVASSTTRIEHQREVVTYLLEVCNQAVLHCGWSGCCSQIYLRCCLISASRASRTRRSGCSGSDTTSPSSSPLGALVGLIAAMFVSAMSRHVERHTDRWLLARWLQTFARERA